jgi:hypothetical protein
VAAECQACEWSSAPVGGDEEAFAEAVPRACPACGSRVDVEVVV